MGVSIVVWWEYVGATRNRNGASGGALGISKFVKIWAHDRVGQGL